MGLDLSDRLSTHWVGRNIDLKKAVAELLVRLPLSLSDSVLYPWGDGIMLRVSIRLGPIKRTLNRIYAYDNL